MGATSLQLGVQLGIPQAVVRTVSEASASMSLRFARDDPSYSGRGHQTGYMYPCMIDWIHGYMYDRLDTCIHV
jgi:hypothetical protein